MTDEYISRQAAIDYLMINMRWIDEDDCTIDDDGEKQAIITDLINGVPPADVRPVVRGRWVPKNSDGSWRVDTCSICKNDTHYVNYAPDYDFCPHCGADMREAAT